MFDAYDDWQKDDFLARYRVPVEGQTFYENSECAHCSTRLYGKRVFWVPTNGGEVLVCESCANQPKPVEGAVLPERPKLFADGGPYETWESGVVEAYFTLLETKLTEAIAQRDVAQDDRDSYKNACSANREELISTLLRAENAEAALATEKALSTDLRNALVLARLQHPEPDYDTTVAERSINL